MSCCCIEEEGKLVEEEHKLQAGVHRQAEMEDKLAVIEDRQAEMEDKELGVQNRLVEGKPASKDDINYST